MLMLAYESTTIRYGPSNLYWSQTWCCGLPMIQHGRYPFAYDHCSVCGEYA